MTDDRQAYKDVVKREGWAPGPWDDEPLDKAVWTDEATGYPCMIVRHPRNGNWCGYVGVPEGHKLYGVGYVDLYDVDDLELPAEVNYSAPCFEEGPEEKSICHIPLPGESDNVWWFGFDCGHYMDISPGTEAALRQINEKYDIGASSWVPFDVRPTYKTEAYVRSLTSSLAEVMKGAE